METITANLETFQSNWIKVKPFGEDCYTFWFNGIYKIVSYDDIKYHAYYLPDYYENWGDHVCQPPIQEGFNRNKGHWPSLESAQLDCYRHSLNNRPTNKQMSCARRSFADSTKNINCIIYS